MSAAAAHDKITVESFLILFLVLFVLGYTHIESNLQMLKSLGIIILSVWLLLPTENTDFSLALLLSSRFLEIMLFKSKAILQFCKIFAESRVECLRYT